VSRTDGGEQGTISEVAYGEIKIKWDGGATTEAPWLPGNTAVDGTGKALFMWRILQFIKSVVFKYWNENDPRIFGG
jgi:hypothetical protein